MEAKRQTPLWLFGALLAWSVTSAPLQAADATNDLEFRVKAAYLFNFLSFVDYPETALSPASGRTICVLGDDPIRSALDEAARVRTARAYPVRVRRITAAAQAPGCHVLFLALADRRQMREIVEPLHTSPILTVSEHPEFLNLGGTVLLYIEAGRLQFEIDAAAAKRAGLHISSKLLVLSRSAR